MDLCQGGPGVDPGHRGKDSHPPRDESRGASHPGEYPRNLVQDGPKGLRTPGWETPLHAPRGARDGGSPLSHSAPAELEESGPGVAISVLPPKSRGLEGARPSGGVQADTPCGNCPS